MDLQFTNFGTSTIANVGGIGAGDLSVDVQAGHGALFPVLTGSKYFYCVLVDTSGNREIVKVTARVTDTFTIVRAQDGTSARVFAADDKIELRVNAGALGDIVALIEGVASNTDFTKNEDDMVSDSDTHLSTQQAIKAYVDGLVATIHSNLYAPATTDIVGFCQNSAPTLWTRKTDRQDNAMICLAASGNPGSGGSETPQAWTTDAQTLQASGSVGGRAVAFHVTEAGGVIYSLQAGGETKGILTTTVNTASFAPYYQEVIEATKD